MPATIRKTDLHALADEAYAYGCAAAPNSYHRGYAMAVEDLARLLCQRDPGSISEALVEIVKAAGIGDALPELYHWGA
jgi:hypothetical protein